ncbi:MAG TPA: HemK/PrmC family methyltransferase, partial [bacterium]|nr:HemK/PrmC family methyltransferase [bacterium]
MKYFELLKLSADYLKNKNIETAQLDAEILLSFADNITREKLISLLNYDVSEKTVIFFRKLIRLRGARIPIAYIIGEKEFYSYKFFVDESCLIPRPETEQIIDLAIDNYKNKNSKLKILDLCVGSGNICLTLLLKFSNAKAVAVDISEKALLALYNNAEYHSLLNRIMIINADVLSLSFSCKIVCLFSPIYEIKSSSTNSFFTFTNLISYLLS